MVRHDQPVGRNERPRAAVIEPHCGRAKLLHPTGTGLESILGFERVEREVIENPHTLISARWVHRDEGNGQETDLHCETQLHE
jgi:hypothetical protein